MGSLQKLDERSAGNRLLQGLWTGAGALVIVGTCLLVLPLLRTISKSGKSDMLVRQVDTAGLPPPPPPPPPPEPEPEEEELDQLQEPLQPAQPMSLAELELDLSAEFAGGWGIASAHGEIKNLLAELADVDSLFGQDDLDVEPRAIFQAQPAIDAKLRRRGGGTVYIIFTVDEQGRVHDPLIQDSPDPIFEKPALAAVKQWRFEPGRHNGKPVSFRMRVPITFPES